MSNDEGRPPLIQIFSGRNKAGEKRWHFRVRNANGEIVAGSEVGDGYSRKIDCIKTISRLRATLIEAEIVNVETGELV